MAYKIAPSLMCANLLRLQEEIEQLERANVDMLHIDVMDGHFVPNLALNLDIARQIQASTAIPLDIHLMVEEPEAYVNTLAQLSPCMVSFHIEATRNPIRLARTLRRAGSRVGLALNPSTPLDALAYLLDEVDYFLVMTVEPGFAGQSFLPHTLAKIAAIRRLLLNDGCATEIEVDGNLDAARSSQCIDQGASILVAGTSSVFRPSSDVLNAAIEFRRRVDSLQAQGRCSVGIDQNNQDGTS